MRAVIATAVGCLSMVGMPQANAQEALRKPISIPAQDLGSALEMLSAQRDTPIVFFAEDVKRLRAQGVSGSLTVEEVLARLLSNTGLTYRYIDEHTITIVPSKGAPRETAASGGATKQSISLRRDDGQPLRLAQVEQKQTSESDSASRALEMEVVNVFGTLEREVGIGSKSGESLRKTPKSVTVVSRERMEAQNLTSLLGALEQTTGVTVVSYTPLDNFYYSRGYQVNTVQLDGGAPGSLTGRGVYMTPDTAIYDHVEMLRGVDGMYTGAGQPGGVVNLVRKRAKSATEFSSHLSSGRWDFYRAEVDLTGPLTEDGRLRGRVVGAYQSNDYFYDRAESDKKIAYATAEYDLTPSTLVMAGASHERRKEDGYFTWGLPTYTDGRFLDVPRSTALNPEWAHYYYTTNEAFLRLEQRYAGNGTLRLNVSRVEQDNENWLFLNNGAVDPVTHAGNSGYAWGDDVRGVMELADLSASGTFGLFGREHRYTVGIDYAKVDGGDHKSYDLDPYTWPGVPLDVLNFDPSLYPRPTAVLSADYLKDEATQKGYYATVGLQISEPLRLTLGGRYGEYRSAQVRDYPSYGFVSVSGSKDHAFIPSAALSWDFAQQWTAYASYAETFEIQSDRLQGPLPGTPLDPVTGEGYEIGVKGELMNFLNVSMAAYRTRRVGQAVTDLSYPYTETIGSSCCYVSIADVSTRGFDAEVSGEVWPGMQLFAGYTFNEREDHSSGAADPVYYFAWTPKHLFKMWGTWQLPGAYSRWTVNLGINAQSRTGGTPSSGSQPFIRQGGYTLWNASVGYRLHDHWEVSVFAENLFDKTFYQLISSPNSSNVYGTPRNVVLSLKARW